MKPCDFGKFEWDCFGDWEMELGIGQSEKKWEMELGIEQSEKKWEIGGVKRNMKTYDFGKIE